MSITPVDNPNGGSSLSSVEMIQKNFTLVQDSKSKMSVYAQKDANTIISFELDEK